MLYDAVYGISLLRLLCEVKTHLIWFHAETWRHCNKRNIYSGGTAQGQTKAMEYPPSLVKLTSISLRVSEWCISFDFHVGLNGN